MNFGEKLYQIRRKNGLSQEELGERLNVTRQTISKWELGQSKPDTDKVAEIAQILEVDFKELIDDSANITSLDESQDYVDSDELKPRKWLLILLIIIALIIIVVLLNKIVTDNKSKKEKEQNLNNSIYNLFEDTLNTINDNSSDYGNTIKDIIDLNEDDNVTTFSFNSGIESYNGTSSGFFIKNMLDNVVTKTKKYPEHKITIIYEDVNTTEEAEIRKLKNNFEDFTNYEVWIDYDEQGYINKITIEK